MSKNRFKFLNRMITFDDVTTREARKRTDRFAPIRELFESWNNNCSSTVNIGDFYTIDECLYALRNPLTFKVYNPNKPGKYGINIKCLNEVLFAYTYRSEPFAGKPENVVGARYYEPTTLGVTLRLLQGYGWRKLEGGNLTTDNLYTSVELAETLLARRITLLGTMRMNRKGLTKEMKSTEGRDEYSTIVWHEVERGKMSIVSYVVNTKSRGIKNILVLSTLPNLSTMGVTKDDGKKKPAAIKVYDFSKGGTDIVDQRLDSLTTATKSKRWTRKFFHNMLDVTRSNSQSVSSLNQGINPRSKQMNSFRFAWNLGRALVLPLMRERKAKGKSGLQKGIIRKIDFFLTPEVGDDDEAQQDETQQHGGGQEDMDQDDQDMEGGHYEVFPYDNYSENRRRCVMCVSELPTVGYKVMKNKLGKSKTQCSRCSEPVCMEHSQVVCRSCTPNLVVKPREVAD